MTFWSDQASGGFWANQIGVASAATAPAGTIPQYGLALDAGLAPWDSETFSAFAADAAERSNAEAMAAAKAQQEEEPSDWLKALGAVGGFFTNVLGTIHKPAWASDAETGKERIKETQAAGKAGFGNIANTPGVKPALHAIEEGLDVIETPFIASTIGYRQDTPWWFLSGDTWAQAWRLAETKTPGQALVDWVVQGADPSLTNKDLDRLARTNSLYGMASFAGDFALGWRLDPTVLGAKGIGEARNIATGRLPGGSAVSKRNRVQAEARRVVQGRDPYRGIDLGRRYGAWRGEMIVNRFDNVRQAARTMPLAEFSNTSMFRRDTVGGPALAMAFKVAANDDALWDLTQRASFADPKAWAEIRAMRNGEKQVLDKYAGSDAQTFIDALNASEGRFAKLESELADLDAFIAKRRAEAGAADDATDFGEGYHAFYNKELMATREKRAAELTELRSTLDRYDDYGTWLEAVPSFDNPRSALAQVSARPAKLDFLSRRLYQKNLFGPVHSIAEISKAGWLKEASPIDLHRVESGTVSLRRQFEQLAHHADYVDADAVSDVLERFTKASIRQNYREAYLAAKEVDEIHLPRAVAQREGLEPETVLEFLQAIRFKQNEMANALVTGENAVYTTAPGMLDQEGARLIERANGKATIEIIDGGRNETIVVPEEALDSMLPVSETQTPNWYTPLNAREVFLAVRRDKELFRELESARQNQWRGVKGASMEWIDSMGGKWNHFWKPFQLFRLAWPQRVIMDESLRSMAKLGALSWGANSGRALADASINAVNPVLHPNFASGLYGGLAGAFVAGPLGAAVGATVGPITTAFIRSGRQKIKLGPGRIADEAVGRRYNPDHAAKVAEAPIVPVAYAANPSKKRLAGLAGQVDMMAAIRRHNLRQVAFGRHQAAKMMANGDPDMHMPADPTRIDATPQAVRPYELPVNFALKKFVATRFREGQEYVESVVDPVTGKPVKSGYAVPVKAKELREEPAELSLDVGPGYEGVTWVPSETKWQHDLNDFIMDNAELLATPGYRLRLSKNTEVAPRITAEIVRVFKGTERTKAVGLADNINPGQGEFYELGSGRHFTRDWNDKSPIMEALDRRFRLEEEEVLAPTDAPANVRGQGPYHGSQSGLPDDLNNRYDVPMLRGNLMGRGFYTTMSLDIASQYGHSGVYSVRGSKSGKRYRIWNLEKGLTAKDVDDLLEFGEAWVRAKLDDPNIPLYRAEELQENWRNLKIDIEDAGRNETHQWFHLFSNNSPWSETSARVDDLLTEFLETKRNAGVLTHLGGGARGLGGPEHTVYIWLKPEDLDVRPAWEKTGRWYSLEEWFDNPESPDQLLNPVPENRIHRTGAKPRAQARAEQQRGEEFGERQSETVQSELDPDLDFSSWLADAVDHPHERFIRRLLRRREFGKGTAKYRSRDGKRIIADDALEGPGEIYTALMSSSPAFARLTDTYKRTLSMMRSRAVGYKRYYPPRMDKEALATSKGQAAALEYFDNWVNLINDQIRNDQIWWRMLEGQSDDQIIDWLRNTGEGARLRRNLPHKGYSPERWVEEHRSALDFYVPDTDLQKALTTRRVEAKDLTRIDQRDLPEIYGPELEMISGGTGVGRLWGDLVQRTYHALGTVPTDTLVRQPFFRGMYNLKMRNLVSALDADEITPDLLRAYEKQSREFALRQVKRTMFDLSDDTNMTQFLRFISPFWGAQQEAILKWANIAVDKPETVARFYVGQEAVYEHLTVIDEDGHKVSSPDGPLHYNPEHRVLLQIPKGLEKVAPFDKALEAFGEVGIKLGAVNTALQGDNPLLPGLGPLVALPADWLIKSMWDSHGTEFDDNFFYRWIFPIGRPASGISGALESIMPGWARRMYQMKQGMDSTTYANTWFMVKRELDRDAKKKGLRPPTPEEIDEATRFHFGLRVVAAFGLPAAMEFRPKHQFYLDEYHDMQQKFGPRAFEKFVEKHGADAAAYAASSSTGLIPATGRGQAEWRQIKKIMAKHPDWSSAMFSPDAWADEFSSDSYRAQFDIKLGPGDSTPLRELRDPEERQAWVDTQLGWIEYRKLQAAVDAELFARGLTSINQSAARDIAVAARYRTSEIAQQYPAWSKDKNTLDLTVYDRVNELAQWAGKKEFDNRPDIQGVRQYLTIREQTTAALDFHYYNTQGQGSRSLQAEENWQLRNWHYQQVGQLLLDNPQFAEFYHRYLDGDTLERGSG